MIRSRRIRDVARLALLVPGTLLLAALLVAGLARPLRQVDGAATAIRRDYNRMACLERAVRLRVDRNDRVYVPPDADFGLPLMEMATPRAHVVADEASSTVVLRVTSGGDCGGARLVVIRR